MNIPLNSLPKLHVENPEKEWVLIRAKALYFRRIMHAYLARSAGVEPTPRAERSPAGLLWEWGN